MKTSILYIFLLSVLYACDSHSLLPPKQQLDQQIAQLNDYSLLSGRLNDQLCEEIETHAQEIGNDSLLLATRQIIYTRYCRLQDTAHARMLLDRMKPYAIRIKDKHLLMNHLRMAFLHAQIRQPAECERWINEARKYAYINPQNWYITAANACLECGLYPQALIYADSALVNLKYKVISSPHLVKAIALSRTGKTAEAEEWTQRCITDIRHFQAKHQIHTISYLQYQLFMEYAVSLRKHGKNKEALSVLEELDRVSFNNVATPLLRNKDNIEEYKVRVARMLSECHYATGNQSEAIQQAIPLCPRANEHTPKDDQRKPTKRTIIHPLKKSEDGGGTGTAHPVYPNRNHYFTHGYPNRRISLVEKSSPSPTRVIRFIDKPSCSLVANTRSASANLPATNKATRSFRGKHRGHNKS